MIWPVARPAALAALLLFPLLAPAPGAAQSVERLRDDVADIEEDLAEIRARLGMPPAGGARGGAMSDAIVRLGQLEAELREITGRLERLEFEQRRIAEDAARRFSDIEFRLTEIEGGDISNLTPVPALGSDDGQAEAQAVSVSERNDLDRAIEDVRQGRYDQAEDRLRRFLNDYPESPLEPEALYWLGESQFTRGAYQEAARSHLEGYKVNRTGPEAARNLYRLGVTLGQLGQVNEACLTLAEVRRQFPRGPDDVLAGVENEAGALGCG